MKAKENQNIEWKESWRDEYLKWICGFANADGGKLIIGKSDDGEVVGVNDWNYRTPCGPSNGLLLEKLSDGLTDVQKRTRINHLPTKLRRAGGLRNVGPRKTPQWRLAE